MKSTWKGLLLEFSCGRLDGGPGLRPDFCIEEVTLLATDMDEFRANFPEGTPDEIFEKHQQAIDDYLYAEVARGDHA